MRLIAAVVSGLLLSSPALSQSPPGTPGTPGSVLEQTGGLLPGQAGTTTTTDPEMVDSARRICRQVPTSSGSRMATRRLCMTAERWRNWQRTH